MSTTINSFSVGLSLDASEYIQKAGLAGNETRRLVRAIEEARTPAERYSLQQDRLSKALQKGAIDQGTYNRLLESAKAKQDAMTKSVKDSTAAFNTNNTAVKDGIGKLKGLAAAYLGFGTVKKSIGLAIEAEQASAAFEVLTGSVQDSVDLLSDLRRFSDVSPLTFSGVQGAAKMMLSFNIPLEEVISNIKMLGDISGGNQARFDSLTLAFSQMSAAGRMMGQDLLQMINAGFNPLQEISRKTGESMVELKARMEDGRISASEVRDAFMSATSEGGKFHGMTERMAETMGGKLAISMATLEKAGIKLGESLSPLIISMTDGFDKGASSLESLIFLVEKFADGLGFGLAAAKDLMTVLAAIARGETFETLTTPIDNVSKFLDRLEQRRKEREEAAFAEQKSAEIKARQEATKQATERSGAQSVGVLASAIGTAIQSNAEAFRPQDLLVPTPGELIIADAVEKAVDAIKENSFSRIR